MDSGDMSAKLEGYLQEKFGPTTSIETIKRLVDSQTTEDELKGFGYGKPYLIKFTVEGEKRSAVLSSMKPDRYGHDHFSDRAQVLLWQHSVFNKLPRHVKALDVGYFTPQGELKSADKAEEYFILMEEVRGREYVHDLKRIMNNGIKDQDNKRVRTLSSYLAHVHSVKKDDPKLYIRRIRELVGHGECIMGLTDSYEKDVDFISWTDLEKIEKKCIDWRWRLKQKTHRLCQVHGDFHPWNVMFRKGLDFTVLDRSRGEWGEAADDLACMSINYIFFSLQKYGKLDKEFKSIHGIFFENYLQETGDDEILEVLPPFYAFRGLVLASPIWYPNLEPQVRLKLVNFISNVLDLDQFDSTQINSLF